MQDRKNNQQEDQSQQANPETLAVSDEKQRTQEEEIGQKKPQIPTGNERGQKNETDGAQAGIGE